MVAVYLPDTIVHQQVKQYKILIFRAVQSFEKKPDPEGLLWILDKLGVSPEEGIYIGDSDVDMKTGKAAGMFTVGAEWGFGSEK